MGFTGSIEDRLLIRERLDIYADATFRGDVDAYLGCWADDGLRIWAGTECRGKPALRAQWEALWRRIERMAFFAEPGAIAVDGDQATARCYCREIVKFTDGSIRKFVGIYDDELVRADGAWLFARRDYTLFLDEGA
jgi:ketosteroid isomerase-like protein